MQKPAKFSAMPARNHSHVREKIFPREGENIPTWGRKYSPVREKRNLALFEIMAHKHTSACINMQYSDKHVHLFLAVWTPPYHPSEVIHSLGPQAIRPWQAILRPVLHYIMPIKFEEFETKSVGLSDVSSKLSTYGLSGWVGSKLFTSQTNFDLVHQPQQVMPEQQHDAYLSLQRWLSLSDVNNIKMIYL